MKYLPTFTKDLRNWHRSIFYAWSIWAYHTCTHCIQFIWKLIQLFPNLCQHKSSTNSPSQHPTATIKQRLHRTSTWAPLKFPKKLTTFSGGSTLRNRHTWFSEGAWEENIPQMVVKKWWWIPWDRIRKQNHLVQTNIYQQNDGFSRKTMLVDPRSDMCFQEPCDGISTNLSWVKRVG